jgi:hypothetical protein
VGDDYVFTKNGYAADSPSIIQTREEMNRHYLKPGGEETWYRRKPVSGPVNCTGKLIQVLQQL